MAEWLPIDSVPKDGTPVTLKVNNAPMFEGGAAEVTLEVKNSWFDTDEECWVYAIGGKIIPLLDMYAPVAWSPNV